MITMSIDEKAALKALGFGEGEFDALANKGIVVSVFPSGLKFSQNAEVLADLPIKASDLSAMIKNKTAPTPEQKDLAVKAYGSALVKAKDGVGPIKKEGPAKAPPPKAPAPEKTAEMKFELPVIAGVEFFDVSKMQTADRVPLSVAEKMYAPVKGSDDSSRYFVVGISSKVKVAARYRNNKLSVRVETVEGFPFGNIASALGEAGLKISNAHASQHFEGLSFTQASRTLGAMLMALDVPMQTPLPDLKVIANKGS